jgi:hypothetical protein
MEAFTNVSQPQNPEPRKSVPGGGEHGRGPPCGTSGVLAR